MVQDDDERHIRPSEPRSDDARLPTREPSEKAKEFILRFAQTYSGLGRNAILAEARRQIGNVTMPEVNWVLRKYNLPNQR
ncbi:hypothetical protein [Actinoplanes sp. G11-F43]|uniref:hypothetical protein n=1 Tax=Actinoplanes sp. G11-F43 TaxID=3424130 RepID=UPI003D343100